MKPGAPSVNPSGRSSSNRATARSISTMIAQATDGGAEIVEALLKIARKGAPAREAAAAWVHLMDRLVGRPESTTNLQLALSQSPVRGQALLDLPPSERLAFLDAEIARRKMLAAGSDEQAIFEFDGTEQAE
jgi:hypothetical protein